ncbi:hypothetical protein SUGI_1515770 [Cryptomeria japonica]|uniref:Uncharacterized protein n=1 Tax=Cryptomeria japonica TaxID=3369 RepID=A0AAD3NV76_CRYJA|nr:hypothetical protein SUGI_1492420 [Cryptomeria japonica]GLJ59610.1 hypothetical protein SUGI_1515770 [Cryptomeria japonica]
MNKTAPAQPQQRSIPSFLTPLHHSVPCWTWAYRITFMLDRLDSYQLLWIGSSELPNGMNVRPRRDIGRAWWALTALLGPLFGQPIAGRRINNYPSLDRRNCLDLGRQ